MKIIRFTAEWCQPCKSLAKMLTEIQSPVPVEVVDVDDNPGLAEKYQIRSVPTMLMISSGNEVDRLVGSQSKEKIQTWLKIPK